MPLIVRIVLAILLLFVASFCIFGFMACFEPGADSQHILKMIYGSIVLGCLALIGLVTLRWSKRP